MIKKINFILFCISFTFYIHSQEKIENAGISITSSQLRCTSIQNGTDNTYVSLKIQNTNDYSVSIQFDKKMWYDESCVNCTKDSDEYNVSLTLEPYQTIEGLCDKKNYKLLIFHSMQNGLTTTKLSDFKIENLKINKTN